MSSLKQYLSDNGFTNRENARDIPMGAVILLLGQVDKSRPLIWDFAIKYIE